METIDIPRSGESVYLVTRQLSISPALDADSNNYSCVATNDNQRQPSDSIEFELIVRGKRAEKLGRSILRYFSHS